MWTPWQYLATKVTKSQYSLTISHNNDLDCPFRPILQYLKNFSSETPRTSMLNKVQMDVDFANKITEKNHTSLSD